jgi:hypothetical protein
MFEPLDFDPGDAAPVHFDNGKTVTFVIKIFSPTRDEPEPSEDKASCGCVGGVFGQDDVVLCREVAKAQGGVKYHRRIGALPNNERLLHHVKLVMNLAYELL